jgi:peptidyl-prolyl cis-trans isomerase C
MPAMTKFSSRLAPTVASAIAPALALALAFSPLAQAQTTTGSATTSDNPVVASYKGGEVRRAAFEEVFRLFAGAALNQQGQPYSLEGQATLDDYRNDVLQALVVQELQLQAAAKLKVVADEAAVNETVTASLADFADEAALKTALNGAGFNDLAEYRRYVVRGLTIEALQKRFSERVKFGDVVVKSIYTINKPSFKVEAQACASHILLPNKADAEAVIARLAKNEDFAAVAKELSQDPGSKDSGGDLGCVGKGQTVAAFDKAIFEGPLGAVQGPIETEFGFHVVRVSKRNAAGMKPVEEAAPAIRQSLANRALKHYNDALAENGNIQINTERLGKTVVPEKAPEPAGK